MVFYIFLSYLPFLALFLYKSVSTWYHFPLAWRTFLHIAYSARLLAMNSLSCSFIEIKMGFLRSIFKGIQNSNLTAPPRQFETVYCCHLGCKFFIEVWIIFILLLRTVIPDRGQFSPQGKLTASADILIASEGCCYCHLVGKAKDVAKHPSRYKTLPKNSLPISHSAAAEGPCCGKVCPF